MGKPAKTTRGRVARATRWARDMVTDVLVTMVFFLGALLIGAVVMFVLTGDDDDV